CFDSVQRTRKYAAARTPGKWHAFCSCSNSIERAIHGACSVASNRGVSMEGSVYLKARQEWDERYADLVLGKRNWQITAAGMMVIALVLAVGMVWLSARSRFVP